MSVEQKAVNALIGPKVEALLEPWLPCDHLWLRAGPVRGLDEVCAKCGRWSGAEDTCA